jgi:recombination protein RecR
MPDFAEPLARLITEFKHLPGVRQKSAQRLEFNVMRSTQHDTARLSKAIIEESLHRLLLHMMRCSRDEA